MKKSMKLTTLLASIAMLFISLLLCFSLYTAPVSASAATTGVFEMEQGAGVKLSADGLRFKARMSQDVYDKIVTNDSANKVELWGYIAPVEQFDLVDGAYKDLAVKVGGKLDEGKIYLNEDDGYYYANIAMTNLNKHDYQARSFSAIMFIVDNTSGSAVYTYADLAKDNGISDLEQQNRTQYEIVNAAMLDADESYEKALMSKYGAWYGSSTYPIFIDNQAEYDAFKGKVDASAEFATAVSGKTVIVAPAISSYAMANKVSGVSIKAQHTVTFYDGYKVLSKVYVTDNRSATAPKAARDGYEFVEWVGGDFSKVTGNMELYAKWKEAKGDVKDIGNMKVYGATLANGGSINTDADVIDQKVVLAPGELGDGVYYPAETAPTDGSNTADQAYIAYDGNYGFNDYFVADFTGKNMPTLAFFANNYNNSIFYGDGNKNGVVVATGLTLPDGRLFTENIAYCTTVFNGAGLCMWGPHMIYNTAHNIDNKGVLLHGNGDIENVAIGRANLVDEKQYRIIMGIQPGDDASNKAIKLVYTLYDLDNDVIVETKAINTYNFFADGWANAGQTRDQFCQGSIVAYGYFGTKTVLDKTYPIYEDTTIEEISRELGMSYSFKTTVSGDTITLGKGSVGGGANYTKGQQVDTNTNDGTPSYVSQAYYALEGDYSLNDYVVFDFTGKNMPEISFFSKNYNDSMYAEGTSKQGIVVVTGITTWDGQLSSGVNGNGTQINYGFPYMIQDASNGGFCQGALKTSNLGRANLVDGTHYRVIMGFTGSGNTITLHWYLYDLDTNTVVEQSSMTTWGFFSGSNAQVGNMTINDLVGSIVLYGKFGITCTIDKLYGVYENTTIGAICDDLRMDLRNVTFQNYDGNVLEELEVSAGATPSYSGETPYRPGDMVYSSYTFAGWDKALTVVTGDTVYTAVFTPGAVRENVTMSTSKGVTNNGNAIVLTKSGIGDGANYVKGQNNGGYVDQSYLAFDGNYALNDFIALEFTGKNLPEIAFFAKNYNESMYAESTDKQGIVVVTGITTWDGQLSSGVNGNGTQINYGFPYMIQDASNGGFCQGALKASKLGRANLVDGTHYRVIMGFTGSGNAITLHWYLYNLDTHEVVEQSSMTTWNFFTGSNTQVGNMTINDLAGSIVLYGKFGIDCTIDRLYGVFEDTDIATVANGLNSDATYNVKFVGEDGSILQESNLPYGVLPEFTGELNVKENDGVFNYTASWDNPLALVTGNVQYNARSYKDWATTTNVNNASFSNDNDSITLNAGSIGDGANYVKGQNNGGYVRQSYLALDGNYALNDYVALEFTGKNLPEIAFFAKNYNDSMYAEDTSKQGIVVVTGITTWDGQLSSGVNGNGTQINYGFPYMIQDASNGGFCQGALKASNLGRANLVDGTHYRVIMGFTGSGNAITLHWYLYNLDTNTVVEQSSMTTWGFFSGSNAQVGNMTINDLSGSIVLYGKFGVDCAVDKLYGVFTDTTLDDVAAELLGDSGSSGEEPDQPGETPALDMLGYDKYEDKFDFYAYSAHSDGTYEIDGEKYYIGKDLSTIKQYSLYGGAGMTIYFPQSDYLIDWSEASLTKAKKLLDDLAKAGIYKTILQDSRILYLSTQEKAIVGSGCTFATEADLDAYIYDCVKGYANYPGVYGIMLGDEPKYSMLSAYAAVYNSIKRVNAKYGFNLFIQYNLNPLNVTQKVYDEYYPATSGTYEWNNVRYRLGVRDRFEDCVARYTQYINDFLNAMKPDSIMYDDYPLMENKNGGLEISDSYIPCLQIVAKAAADKGIAFYNVTQTFENNADGSIHRRAVTEAGAKWLNNILVGFGAKQIAYYTYYTRTESDSTGGESYVDGQSFVDYNGNKTALYDIMKEIMSDNQTFASTVLQFNYVGSKIVGSTSASHLKEITVSNSFTKLSSCSVNTGSALVTELYDDENDKYMYMAMNVLDPDTAGAETVSMTFSGYNKALVYDGMGNFSTVTLSGGVYSATLNAGDAVYVIPYNA